ncbi:MAG: MFS transporter [Acidobacteriota bacterium]|nr:MFS transporter [Acidobacteriota bacterium]
MNGGAPKQLWVLMATVFIDMVGALIVLPLLPFYADNYDAGGWVIGLLTSIFAGAQLLSAPFWGRLSDHYGRRPVILGGLVASAFAYVCFGLASSLSMLFVTRLLQGLGAGTIGVIQAYVSDAVPAKERAKALGWLTAAASAGVTIGPLLGSVLAELLGQRGPGLFAAGLCVLNVVFAWRLLKEPTRDEDDGTDRRSVLHSIWEVVRHPSAPVSSLIWVYVLAMMAFMGFTAMMALYLKDRFGITERDIGWFYAYVGVVSVLMRGVALGPILDRLGESRAMRTGAAAMSLGFLFIPMVDRLSLFILASTLIPVGTAMLFPTSTSMLTQRSRRGEVGQTLGVQQAFRGISGILGPAWAGASFQWIHLGAPLYISSAIMALVLFVTLIITNPEEDPQAAAEATAAEGVSVDPGSEGY